MELLLEHGVLGGCIPCLIRGQRQDAAFAVLLFREIELRVIIEKRVLQASNYDGAQRIALVYSGPQEYRVYAPSRASGDPVQWSDQLLVHIPSGFGELALREPQRSEIVSAVFAELEKSEVEAARAEADSLYCDAQICLQGDVQSSDGTPFDPKGHCPKCGSECIQECLNCHALIRGRMKHSSANYECPSFCHRCGKPYPWMEDKLRTAKDLLFQDDKLTYEDKKELWGLLQYVMSNPKAELAKGKSKLLAIKIQEAAEPIKEFVTDFLAKYAAEMSKG